MKMIFGKSNTLGIKKDKIKKTLWILGSHAFLIILLFILLNLILGVFLFYKYVILVEIKEPEIIGRTVNFKYNIYQEVLKDWQIKGQSFEEFPDKKYLNPFSTE